MKVHYINILLFAFPLNILVTLYHVNTHKKLSTTTCDIQTTRLLCECELYAPANYDNDPQMKEVMDKFSKQTQQRFEEYDERLQEKRQICKDKCDKEIQKIILKDKIEKQMQEQFATLQTDIQSDSIPTCVCEKSLADKFEKTCLKCGGVLGGGVAPELGLIGGTALYGISVWKPKAIASAIVEAQKAGEAAGKAAGDIAGVAEVISGLKSKFSLDTLFGTTLDKFITTKNYVNETVISGAVKLQYQVSCATDPLGETSVLCFYKTIGEPNATAAVVENAKIVVTDAIQEASEVAFKVTASKTAEFKEINIATVESICNSYNTAIIASIATIVVIILVMIVIYLILRYSRKKKMKKKLQYIKLLNQ
ncbi:rifin [Plasmodium falciparum NF54]|uniref:Rifin n=2 Tax=Plasmodium falciparum TaxID=5833 RepID=Q8I3D2_PLAF7|nr:rifin [Plasmodium falciparum 3D7]KAF4330734.1 rifin [Plasmodium falciparum NF54]PKC45255.1 rifin [Plasmodium falciparum NF54]CAD51701.1 rifin [Plasmodium falciparum 3D7]|eukprot:XP_001351890.1 rifin [Plasmodium falciparum 3D7]